MAFVVWGLLACSGVYWAIQLLARPLSAPAQALPVGEHHAGQGDLTRLFGAAMPTQAEPVASVSESRFQLLGVVAPRRSRLGQPAASSEGVALIAVDGVARTVRIGAVVEGELRLLSVDTRSASLGHDGVVAVTLQLAPPSAASTGSLPPATPSSVVLGGNPPHIPGQPIPIQAPQGQPLTQPVQILPPPAQQDPNDLTR